MEEDAFAFAAQAEVPVYVFGGLRRELYQLSEPELSDALVREAEGLMDRGCAGIKMLEGKPQIRKAHPTISGTANGEGKSIKFMRNGIRILYRFGTIYEKNALSRWAFLYGNLSG